MALKYREKAFSYLIDIVRLITDKQITYLPTLNNTDIIY